MTVAQPGQAAVEAGGVGGSRLIAVVGPTATGKTSWGLALAEAGDGGGEIVGADSRQVYRGLDIGTAKPSREELARVRHHCLDHVDPRERYHLARYLREARAAVAEIRGRGRRPLLVGGTGQYVWALLEGWDVPNVPPDADFRAEMEARAKREGLASLHAALASVDPKAAAGMLPGNVRRVVRALEVQRATGRPISSWHEARDPMPAVVVAPVVEADELYRRIDARVEEMFARGLVEETEALLSGWAGAGLPDDAPGLASIGYAEVVRYLRGEFSLEEAVEEAKRGTRRFARRQRAWFRRSDARIRWCTDVAEALVAAGG